MNHQSRGFILVIVVGLLGVLAFVALDLASESRQGRLLSQRGVNLAKATLAARSGLEKGVEAALKFGRKPESALPFSGHLMSHGEDRNKNGVLESVEDLDGDGRNSFQTLDEDLTPSLALPEPGTNQSLLMKEGSKTRGVTWVNGDKDQLCTLRISVPCLDLNAGVEAGEGAEGQRLELNEPLLPPYDANSLTHPFNIPLLRFLNSWGNYHKYKAMIRFDKTYDFDRSTDNGLVDSPSNLMGNQAEAEDPSSRFDDFNPSGNHTLNRTGGALTSEIPLGERVVSHRPVGGYRNVGDVLLEVEAYVRSWVDKEGNLAVDGNWLYADGSSIPRMTEKKIRAIVEEFKELAVLNPPREPAWVFRRGSRPGPPQGEPSTPGYFEEHGNRHYLFNEVYAVPAMRVDINRAPESVLAALVQAPGMVRMRAYNRSDEKMDGPFTVIPSQSENNHPIFFSYRTASGPIALIRGEPLFSMTESMQMARDMARERQQNRFHHSVRGLRDFLRAWRKGYDAKNFHAWAPAHQFNIPVWGGNPLRFNEVNRYFDWHHGHRRVQILAEFLNPHVNDAQVVWDEALPLAVENRKNRLILTPDNPAKGLFFELNETDQDSGQKGPEVCLQSPTLTMTSLGWFFPTGERRKLSTTVHLYERLEVGTQDEFKMAFDDPNGNSSLGSWVTYPEMSDSPGSVAPSKWAGHLALKPIPKICPWGEELRLRVPLNGYEADPTMTIDFNGNSGSAWPGGPRHLAGPASNPARGILRNSLKPDPGAALTSLYPTASAQIDSASDLMPGGGIRMSPWHNSPMRRGPGGSWDNRREALLVLRNDLVTDADDLSLPDENHMPSVGAPEKILPSFHEGAVSFYVKPRFLPESAPVAGGVGPLAVPDPLSGVATLFYMPFLVKDEETGLRGLSSGQPPEIAEALSQFVGSLRLTWSQHAPFSDRKSRYHLMPGPDMAWPAVQPFASGSFPGQTAMTGPFYFVDMWGFEDDSTGLADQGYVLTKNLKWPPSTNDLLFSENQVAVNQDGIEGHWRAPNPYSNEIIILEWEIHKSADNSERINSRKFPYPASVTQGWETWDQNDEFKTLAQKCAYFNKVTHPLYLYDDSDPDRSEFHSVRKCFYMQGPKKLSSDYGRGPVDQRGDLQALMETGRWNHIFIAWRNLWSVLDNHPPNKGGSLCVYVNGAFRKVSPSQMEVASHFFNFDTSPAYKASGSGPHYSSWDPNEHLIYQVPTYSGPYKNGIMHTKTFCTPRSGIFLGPQNYSIYPSSPPMLNRGPALEPEMFPYHANHCESSGLTEFGEYSPRKQYILRRFPHRFYFGFEPHSIVYHSTGSVVDQHSYFPSNITWASFMDVQIFGKTKAAGPNSPHYPTDGGFLSQLPNFYSGATSFTPYPNLSSAEPARIVPLNLGSWSQRVRGQMDLVGISWSAALPEFHQFWDDQNQAQVGPDPQDVQTLTVEWSLPSSGQTFGILSLTQQPNMAQVLHSELPEPVSLDHDPLELVGEIQFQGPPVVMSTPIIESFELTFARRHPQYGAILIE